MPTQAYYQGDFWEPLEPVNPGDTPSEPRWRRLRVPDELKSAVIYIAAGHVMVGDGMADQARVYIAQGEKLVMQAAARLASQQQQPVPFRVK